LILLGRERDQGIARGPGDPPSNTVKIDHFEFFSSFLISPVAERGPVAPGFVLIRPREV
jgi:hypothetical protein